MTPRQEVEQWVTAKLMEVSDGRVTSGSIHPGTSLRHDLGMTSLLAVNMVLDLEEKFGIEVSDDDLTRLGTVGNVVEMVLEKVCARASGTR